MLRIYKTIENSLVKVKTLKEQNLWIDVTNPTEKELKALAVRYHLDIDLLKASLDDEERPRIEAYDDQMLILISMPNLSSDRSPIIYNTIPLGIVFTEQVIITVSLKESMLIEQFIRTKSLRLLRSEPVLFFSYSIAMQDYS